MHGKIIGMISIIIVPYSLQAVTAEIKAKSTIDFIKTHKIKLELSEQRVTEAIKKGDAILKALYSPNPPVLNNKLIKAETDKNYKLYAQLQREYLDDIVNISWALFADAIAKNQGFTGGTIVVVDPEQRLYNFLRGYVKATNPDTSRIQHISNNPYAYQRESTHFGEFKRSLGVGKTIALPGHEQYGIETRIVDPKAKDLSKKAPTNPEKTLPINKAHFVFGSTTFDRNKPLTFIKWENYGLYGTAEAISHAAQLFKSKAKETAVRRENVPADIQKQFDSLLKSMKPKFLPELEKQAKKEMVYDKSKAVYPIRTIYAKLKEIIAKIGKGTNLPPEIINIKNQAIKLQKDIEKRFDHLDLRRGEEVILTTHDITQ